MTPEEKRILLKEIPKYIKENCYYTDGSIKYYDLWLVGWVAAEFEDRRNAAKVLISNEYGLLGNLLYKLMRDPDESITRFIERTDLEIILKALKENGDPVIWRNDLDDDPYAMRLLIEHNKQHAKYLGADLLNDKAFLVSIASCYPEVLQKTFNRTFEDEQFVFSLIKKNCACLKYLPRKFHSDYKLCLEAVRQEGFSLMYIDFNLRYADEIVLAAVSNRGNALSLATPQQKKNREIVFAAVSNCGLALDHVDESWKHDFDLVSIAVANRGMALRHAAPELQDNEDIVRIAVQNDGYAIRSASDRLRDNYDLALLAMSSYQDAYNYLSPRLQNDPELKHIYLSKKKEEDKWLRSRTR